MNERRKGRQVPQFIFLATPLAWLRRDYIYTGDDRMRFAHPVEAVH